MWLAPVFQIQARGVFPRAVALVVAIGLGFSSGYARAGQLPGFQCADLRAQRDALTSLGAADDLRRGPQWARENPGADRVTRVRQYLTATEQVLFRCDSIPRPGREGMAFSVNMPDPKPYYDRRTFPLPVRKPPVSLGLRTNTQ